MIKFFIRLVMLIAAVGLGRLASEKVVNLSIFSLDNVEIKTNGYRGIDSLLIISGLEKGKSIFKQDIKFAADMISRQNGVVSCTVDRGILSNINVEVEFAEPGLLINGSEVYGLSKEGIVLPIGGVIHDLPHITGKKFREARCYEQLLDPDIAFALELYKSLKQRSPGLCDLLSEINFKGKKLIMIYFSPDGTSVVLNKRYDESDILRLCMLYETGMLKGKRIFDLRFGNVVVSSSMTKGTL